MNPTEIRDTWLSLVEGDAALKSQLGRRGPALRALVPGFVAALASFLARAAIGPSPGPRVLAQAMLLDLGEPDQISAAFAERTAMRELSHLRFVAIEYFPKAEDAVELAPLINIFFDEALAFSAQARERSQRSAAEAALRFREDYILSVIHGFAMPVTAICLNAGRLLRRSDTGPFASVLMGIRLSAEKAGLLLEDAQYAAKSGFGSRLEPAFLPSDASAICRKVLENVGVIYPDRTVRFKPSDDARGVWDPVWVYRAVAGLILNSLVYTDEDAPVSVEVISQEDSVEVRIRHDSPHVLPEDWQRLRLIYVRRLAEALDGRLEGELSAEEGAVFRLLLPKKPGQGRA